MGDLRIALVVATSGGGVGNHVRSLAGGLRSRGHRVAVVGPPATEQRFGFTGAGARFAAVDVGARPRPASDLAAVRRLRRLLADVDIVHAHGIRAGALCALAQASPLIVTLHNAPPVVAGPMRMVFPALERVVARRADLVLGVSADLAQRMRDRGARAVERALVTAPPMGPPRRSAAEVRAELGAGPERPLLLVVARLAAQKGLDVLLDATARLAGRDPAPLVAVAGDGPLREGLAARIAAERLPVRLLGHRTDIADLLGAADMFVLPSLWEGPSLVIMEALRANLPVVATRVGGIPDLYGKVALLVPPGDADALAGEVTRVLDDPALAGRMRDAARLAAVTLPTEDDTVEQVLSLYRRLAAHDGVLP
ncbi:glycosyltransferase family 4 protein [Marinactinospora rubrisoli]|uniref:Glycosyltransferase family 4 protein n=1 Tax=Marinactinospora rubrisoli TaxID=2715399 RepID=A0ABW2KKP6_9ACTN